MSQPLVLKPSLEPDVPAVAPQPVPRVFRPQRATPGDVVRPTRAEISLSNLRFNLRQLRKRTGAAIWCVLKADAYGHGAKACARTLERAGAAGVCVALLEEAIELRNAGVTLPILVMGGYYRQAYAELLEYQLTPVLFDLEQIHDFAREVRYREAPPAGFHLKVDTGMGRLGVMPNELAAVAQLVRQRQELRLDGLMTQFASADRDLDSVAEQLRVFHASETLLKQHGLQPARLHAANTAALLSCPAAHLDLVRPGIGLFGVDPTAVKAPELRPVMRVISTVVALRRLKPGQAVGYGARWTAPRPAVIATLPIGYADGLSRAASNRAEVLVRGRRAPLVGAVSMDLVTVDVTDIEGVAVGDEVVLLGDQVGLMGSGCITAHEVASTQGTIPWEILTHVSRRVPRFYRSA